MRASRAPARGPETARGPLPHGEGASLSETPLVGQRRPALPRTDSAVPSALGGLTSGFGMGPGVPPLPWPLTNKGRSSGTVPWGPHSVTSGSLEIASAI